MKETIEHVIPVVEVNNQLVARNNMLQEEIVSLQNKLVEESKLNEERNKLFIQQMIKFSKIEQWMEEKKPVLEESSILGKRELQGEISGGREKSATKKQEKEKAKPESESRKTNLKNVNSSGWK
jgi:polyhydroxyalkanoate synthesis regulator phasin